MKKIAVFLILLVLSSVILFSCSNNYFLFAKENLSEYRENVFEAKSEKLFVTFMAGMREEQYEFNGISSNLVEFGVITVHVLDSAIVSYNMAHFKLVADGAEFEGRLEINPFDKSLVADICKNLDTQNDITVTVSVGSFEESLTLKHIYADWEINYEKALQNACDSLKKELKLFIENNKFLAEVYVKILYDGKRFVDYFWHISFVGQSGKSMACIIDKNTGEMLAKNSYY